MAAAVRWMPRRPVAGVAGDRQAHVRRYGVRLERPGGARPALPVGQAGADLAAVGDAGPDRRGPAEQRRAPAGGSRCVTPCPHHRASGFDPRRFGVRAAQRRTGTDRRGSAHGRVGPSDPGAPSGRGPAQPAGVEQRGIRTELAVRGAGDIARHAHEGRGALRLPDDRRPDRDEGGRGRRGRAHPRPRRHRSSPRTPRRGCVRGRDRDPHRRDLPPRRGRGERAVPTAPHEGRRSAGRHGRRSASRARSKRWMSISPRKSSTRRRRRRVSKAAPR